jgi:hypothetical protein
LAQELFPLNESESQEAINFIEENKLMKSSPYSLTYTE